MSHVFLTGATGFLGREVLERLLAAEHDVTALVRRPLGDDRVRTVRGDITQPLPELDAEVVVHCAASISFDLPLDEAHAVNVAGTANVMRAAERMPSLKHFIHVSTAYVAGRHEGVFGEDDLDLGQSFRNTYEQTKLAAERRVTESWLPTTVVRPSIVMGDSRTGWTSAFNVLYWPLQAFARGLIDHVPARADGVVDVVPVDYVADAIASLVHRGEPRGTLALVAGPRASTTAEVIGLACEHFDRPAPRLVGVDEHSLPEQAMVYLPYFDVATRFDNSRARGLFGEAPPLEDYFATLMEYATATRWGRRAA
jgi:nucleoside-diphosphate-sugar epimerase